MARARCREVERNRESSLRASGRAPVNDMSNEEMGLTDDEKAFYDALAANESAMAVMGGEGITVCPFGNRP